MNASDIYIEQPDHKQVILDLRPIGIREVPMIGRYNYAHAHRGLGPHSHVDALEICYLAKGTQLYQVGQQDHVLRGGDLFITYPGETHSTGETPQEKGTLYWVQFIIPARPTRFLHCTAANARALLDALRRIPHRQFPGDPNLARLLDEILDIAQSDDDPLRTIALHNRLVGFILEVIHCARTPPTPTFSAAINALLREIDTRIEEPLPLPDLAARAGLSLSRFKARFKAEVGIPPADYIQRRKIAAAKDLLANPRLSVTHIAFRLGFSSSQYFATVFKRYTGKSPAEWRAASPAPKL